MLTDMLRDTWEMLTDEERTERQQDALADMPQQSGSLIMSPALKHEGASDRCRASAD